MATRLKLWEDNLDRANEALTVVPFYVATLGGVTIITNKAQGTSLGNENLVNADLLVFPNRQYVKARIQSFVDSGAAMGLLLRGQHPTDSGYWLYVRPGTGNTQLYRRDAGVLTSLALVANPGWVVGDTMELEADGTTITAFRNGATFGLSATDATFASGKPGWRLTPGGTLGSMEIDALEAGELRDAAIDFGSGARASLATEAFTGTGADLGANFDPWLNKNSLQRNADLARSGVANVYCIERHSLSLQNDQYCRVKLAALNATNNLIILAVRGNAAASELAGYTFVVRRDGWHTIRQWDLGALSAPKAVRFSAIAVLDVFTFEVEGQALKIWQNSTKLAQWHDVANAYTTGAAGLGLHNALIGDMDLDDYEVGNMSVSSGLYGQAHARRLKMRRR